MEEECNPTCLFCPDPSLNRLELWGPFKGLAESLHFS